MAFRISSMGRRRLQVRLGVRQPAATRHHLGCSCICSSRISSSISCSLRALANLTYRACLDRPLLIAQLVFTGKRSWRLTSIFSAVQRRVWPPLAACHPHLQAPGSRDSKFFAKSARSLQRKGQNAFRSEILHTAEIVWMLRGSTTVARMIVCRPLRRSSPFFVNLARQDGRGMAKVKLFLASLETVWFERASIDITVLCQDGVEVAALRSGLAHYMACFEARPYVPHFHWRVILHALPIHPSTQAQINRSKTWTAWKKEGLRRTFQIMLERSRLYLGLYSLTPCF